MGCIELGLGYLQRSFSTPTMLGFSLNITHTLMLRLDDLQVLLQAVQFYDSAGIQKQDAE